METSTALPAPHELRAIWRKDAPAGEAWTCECGYQASLGCNAAHHAMHYDHGAPTLKMVAPRAPTVSPHVRVPKTPRQLIKLMDDVRMAMQLLDLAIRSAEQAGAPVEQKTMLREAQKQLLDGL